MSKTASEETRFVEVSAPADVEALFDRSREEPVLIFKHDPWCIVSTMAHRQLNKIGGEVPTIDVARARTLSLGLAERTGIRHESPQLLVLHNGEVAWHASHGAITKDAVREALDTVGATDPA